MSHKLADDKLVNGYIRTQCLDIMPTEIIAIIFMFYHFRCEFLKFDAEFKTKQVILSDKDRVASKNGYGSSCVVAGGDAVKTGIAVWRMKVCVYLHLW